MPWIAASRALRILSPAMDPERSMTKARLTGIRSARRGASGAVISTRTKRRLRAVVRISLRSARTENGMVPPRGLQTVPCAAIASTRVSSSRRSSASRSFNSRRARSRASPSPSAAAFRPAQYQTHGSSSPCSKPRVNARAASAWRAGLEVGAAEPRPRDAVGRPREDGRLQHVDGVRPAAPARAGIGRAPTTGPAGRGRGAARPRTPPRPRRSRPWPPAPSRGRRGASATAGRAAAPPPGGGWPDG